MHALIRCATWKSLFALCLVNFELGFSTYPNLFGVAGATLGKECVLLSCLNSARGSETYFRSSLFGGQILSRPFQELLHASDIHIGEIRHWTLSLNCIDRVPDVPSH